MWEAAQPMVKRSTQWWEIGLFTMTEDGLDRPDLMMHYGSVPFDMNTVRWGYPTAESAFCLTPNVCRGRSRGTVRLRSPDFRDRARVDPRYFTDPDGHDERVMLHGVKLATRDRARSRRSPSWVERELAPGPGRRRPTTSSSTTSTRPTTPSTTRRARRGWARRTTPRRSSTRGCA